MPFVFDGKMNSTAQGLLDRMVDGVEGEVTSYYARNVDGTLRLFYMPADRQGRWGRLLVADKTTKPQGFRVATYADIPRGLTAEQLQRWISERIDTLPICGYH